MLEAVVLRVGDPAPLVFDRLAARWPELAALFEGDRRGLVRGEMFLRALEAVLDEARGVPQAQRSVAIERDNHHGFGVPQQHFDQYFDLMAEVFRSAAPSAWTSDVDSVWADAVASLRRARL